MRALCATLVLLLALVAVPAAASEEPTGLPEDAPDELTAEQDNADPAHNTCGGETVADSGSEIHRKLIDGPRQPGTDELAFTAGVCVYLPPGYRTSGLRYPVLYLLHGAFGWQDDWVVQGDMQAIMDRVRGGADSPDVSKDMIVVMPDGGYDASWRDEPDGALQNETYVFDHVIPYVDTYFRTIPDRRGRAMSGLSNGGAGTLRMSAHHPDRFNVVTAMSAALPVNTAASRGDVHALNNDPTELAENLNEVELALVWGAVCGTAEECTTYGFAYGFEQACCSNEIYNAKLQRVRDKPYKYEPVAGGHDWYYWTRWLEGTHGAYYREHLADPVAHLADLAPLTQPESFGFRSIDDVVEIYDYTFDNDDARGVEFLNLTEVSNRAITLDGSGTVSVTTAPVYAPGASYTVTDAGDVVANAEGRLSFTIDLGPAGTMNESILTLNGIGRESRTITIDGPNAAGSLEHVYLPGEGHDYHYYLYTPAGYTGAEPLPLQLVIHGANTVALEQVMANGHHAVADREGFMVLYPDFVNEADPDPDGGESTPESLIGSHPGRLWDSNDVHSRATNTGDAAAVVRMVDLVAEARNLDRDRVYVSGMSSGGMMTTLLMGLYPDVFAAGGIVAGCGFTIAACGGQAELAEPLAQAAVAAMGEHARPVPFVQLQGQQDTTISPAAAELTRRSWLMAGNLAAGGTATSGPYPLSPTSTTDGGVEGGHTYTVESYADVDGCPFAEIWKIHEMAHYWPGGTDDPTWAEWTDHRAPNGAEVTWAFFSQFSLDGNAAC